MNKRTSSRYWLTLLCALLLASVLLNVFLQPSSAANRTSDYLPQDFESFFDTVLQEQMTADSIVGATVAVVQNGEVAFAKGYGYADLDAGNPVQADKSLFFIGSDGKLFTWTAVMQLYEQGKLDLHADINTYLDFTVPAAFDKPITMHHLMTHTAGFEEDFNALLLDSPEKVLPLRAFLLNHMPERVYAPGSISAYSNYGTALAGYIIERVSGQSFEAYIDENLLRPLKMEHSFVGHNIPAALSADLAKGYKFQNGSYSRLDFEWTAAVPCAAIRTTVTDLSRFMLAQLGDGCIDGACILRSDTLQLMHQPQFTHHPRMRAMAYGFLDVTINDQRVLWHMGESARFVTHFALIPEHNIGLIVSYNTPPVNGRAILWAFMDAFFPTHQVQIHSQPLPGWEARSSGYNGTYIPSRSAHTNPQILVGNLEAVSVKVENGQLAFNGWRFAESEPGLFHQVNGDRLLAFDQDEQGQRWLFVGPFAYFQVPWFRTPVFSLVVAVLSLLAFLSAWLVWPVRSLWVARKNLPQIGSGEWGLASGLGIFDLGVSVWLIISLVNFGDRFVFPQTVVQTIAVMAWLAVPWTLLVVLLAVRAWKIRHWSLVSRVHYALIAMGGIGFLWLFYHYQLLSGRI
jgi:CubicO group peptidase (beta-lactamase class C family)